MAQPPPDQNYYHQHHHPHSQAHPPHSHAHTQQQQQQQQHHHQHGQQPQHAHSQSQHPQLHLPPQFGNAFDLIFKDRNGAAINYNYIRPFMNQLAKSATQGGDEFSNSLVMRRPRRTRTTFTNSQIAQLEHHFQHGRYLTPQRLQEVSEKLSLGTAQVKIWFKNRRRRHKLQTDGMSPLSPSLKSSDGDLPSFNMLSLNATDTHNTNTLAASSATTSTMPGDQYSDTFNSYYYDNGHQSNRTALALSQNGRTTTHNSHQSQYFPTEGVMPQHTHHNRQQQQQQFEQQQLLQNQLQPYNGIRQFDYAGGSSSSRSSSVLPNVDPLALSPDSDVYEPMSPNNDERSNLCNGRAEDNDVIAPNVIELTKDILNHKKTVVIQSLAGSRKSINGLDKAHNRGITIGNGTGQPPPSAAATTTTTTIPEMVSNIDGSSIASSFSKYGKITQHESTHHGSSNNNNINNYQCTMDTIMQTYNPHRNTASNTQFAYCFN